MLDIRLRCVTHLVVAHMFDVVSSVKSSLEQYARLEFQSVKLI
jgi:hypothetical protein